MANRERVKLGAQKGVAELKIEGQSILGAFQTRELAEKAERKLRDAGYDVVEVDRVSAYPGEDTERLRNPLTGRISSLADLTLGASAEGPNEGILLAAHPSASGMAGTAGVHERGWLVTVVTDPSKVERVVQIMEACEGRV